MMDTTKAAVALAKIGWQVFPLKPRDKVPATAHGCHDGTSDPVEVERLFGSRSDYNLAVATGPGSGIWCLDVEASGLADLDELQRVHGKLPETVTSRTGGGGKHHFFKAYLQDAEIKNRTKIDGKAIDCRGQGGYVCLPPSVHPNGTPYTWGKDPFSTPVALAPEWLRSWVLLTNGKPEPIGSGNGKTGLTFTVGGGPVETLDQAPGVEQGRRHAEALRLIGSAVGRGLDLVEVANQAVAWGSRCSPPMTADEVLKVVSDLSQKHAAKPTLRSVEKKAPSPPPPPWQPFPVEALPQPVRRYVSGAAAAIGVDPSYTGTAILPVLAGAIGNSRTILLKRGWIEPSVLWGCLVGDSGTLKSPAIDVATRHIRRRQASSIETHRQAVEEYERDLADHKLRYDDWRRAGRKKGEPEPEEPQEPVCQRLCVSDITVEGLASLLVNAPRGLLLIRDELAGWFGSYDQYRNGHGGDTAHWLTIFGARDLIVDRKTSGSIFVPRAAVSITGGIQPGTLRRALSREHFENGLTARLLLSMPPRRTRKWSEREINERLDQDLDDLVGILLDLAPQDNGEPVVVRLTTAGRKAWVEFYNEHAETVADAEGDEAAMLAKAEGAAARLALIVHLVRQAAGDAGSAVDDQSIGSGVTLARWYASEALRVYQVLSESDDERQQRRVVDLIRRRGGSITANDLRRRSRLLATSEDAEKLLDSLVKAGLGSWQEAEHGDSGGRPTREFRLAEETPVSETPEKHGENEVSDTDTEETSENQQADEWEVIRL